MSLSNKLKDVAWIVGIPIVFYLGCSGLDSIHPEPQPYIESLKELLSTTKAIAGITYGVFLLEALKYNSELNKE